MKRLVLAIAAAATLAGPRLVAGQAAAQSYRGDSRQYDRRDNDRYDRRDERRDRRDYRYDRRW